MTILIDTDVWIAALQKQPAAADRLQSLLLNGYAAGHDLVKTELMLMPPSKEITDLLSRYDDLVQVPTVQIDISVFTKVAPAKHQISYASAQLICASLKSGARIWSLDNSLMLLATDLGVAYTEAS